MNDNKRIASDVLEAVGGSANIAFATHCMTRLRLNLKNEGLVNDREIKAIEGVLGVVRQGGQFQIIIGPNVSKVYTEFCEIGGIQMNDAVDEDDDIKAEKEKLSLKSIGGKLLNYLSGSMTPLIPVIMAAGMFKTLLALLGPDFTGLISAENDLYILLNFLYNAGFYFIPILIGYNAAKKLDINPMMGAYMGCILLAPGFLALVNEGTAFTVFGIPCALNDYSQTVLPIILSVGVMGYVYKFFNKYIPDILATVFVPFLTMLVMTPISLCLLAPAGTFIGTYISNGLIAFGSVGGFLAVGVVAALWDFLIMSGMHIVIVMFMLNSLLTNGYMDGVCTSGIFASFAVFGVALGAFLRIKNKRDKSMSFGCFISGFLGGIVEPTLFGLCFKYNQTFLALLASAFIGGIYAGITHVCVYIFGSTNVLLLMSFVGGSVGNVVNGCIACALAMGTGTVLTYLFGFSKEELAKMAGNE